VPTLDTGVTPNLGSGKALQRSAQLNHFGVVKALIAAGADVNAKATFVSLLHCAARADSW